MALSQAISYFLNQHCSPWKAVSLERDESVSSAQYEELKSWKGMGAPSQVVLALGRVPERYD
jgi:hypothetical protein